MDKCHIIYSFFTSCTKQQLLAFNKLRKLFAIHIEFICVRSSVLTSSIEISLHRQLGIGYLFLRQTYFYFVSSEKYNCKIGKFSSKNSIRDVSLSRNEPGRDAGHFIPFRDCPGQSGTAGHPSHISWMNTN